MTTTPKSAVLYVFSGTGNTGIVANSLSEGLNALGVRADIVRIEDIQKGAVRVDAAQYDLVGIGCPVIGYTTPTFVTKFARTLPPAPGKKAFVFRTAGGVAPINYNASRSLIRALRSRGYDVFHERIFSISSNWINRFADGVIARLYEATERKVRLMAGELARLEPRELKTGLGQRLMMGTVAAVAPLIFRTVGKDVRVGPECTRCGLCARNCPTDNIVMAKDGVRYRLSCASCLRCVYSCPQGALLLRRFAFFAVPGGYDIRRILAAARSGGQSAETANNLPEPPFLPQYLTDDTL